MSATAPETPAPANQASLRQLREPLPPALNPDQRVDMFSLRGFELTCRIAKALAQSNSVPATYRQTLEKKGRGGTVEYIDNPHALSNCIVAIDIAQSLRVSVMSVMQNGNIIEGRFTWSAQYKIAAINASGRFTPLRFEKVNKGPLKATYKEKQGWNRDKGGFDFKDVEVTGLDNWEVIAWALPHGFILPAGVYTLAQAKAAALPVIEGAPVSMLLAVEEGWYGKSGSKWQTEMKHLMLQYRAGSFFGNIHAPDLLMGMQTTEEVQDITTVDVDQATGAVTKVSTESMVRPAAQPANVVTTVAQRNGEGAQPEDPIHEEKPATDGAAGTGAAAANAAPAGQPEPITFAAVADAMSKATTPEELDTAVALIARVVDAEQQAELNAAAAKHAARIVAPAAKTSSRRAATPTQTTLE